MSTIRKNDASIHTIYYNNLTDSIWFGSAEGDCTLWNLRNEKIVHELSGSDCDSIFGIAALEHSNVKTPQQVYTACADGVIRHYQVNHQL